MVEARTNRPGNRPRRRSGRFDFATVFVFACVFLAVVVVYAIGYLVYVASGAT